MRPAIGVLATVLLATTGAGAVEHAPAATPARHAAPKRAEPASTAPVSPYQATTVGTFLASCAKNNESTCSDLVGNVLINRVDFATGSQVCVSSADYSQGVLTWLAAHPETAAMPTGDGIYLALTTLYPCR